MRKPELSSTTIEQVITETCNPAFQGMRSLNYFTHTPEPRWHATRSRVGSTFIKIVIPGITERLSITADPSTREAFAEYTRKWKEETGGLSSPSSIRMNRNYLKIIGLGSTVIPYILEELERDPRDWFYALEMIVEDKENPTTKDMGFMEAVAAWVKWGREKQLV
jgi:hypothetical protein